MTLYSFVSPLVFCLLPETAHRAAVKALAWHMIPNQPFLTFDSLGITVSGLHFRHPVGLAAGFDKNAEAVSALFRQGFSAVECGTVTMRPQTGNPKPRLFRLTQDKAVINRMGFNNLGIDALCHQLERQSSLLRIARDKGGILGINIGKNKDSDHPVADYVALLQSAADYADYITINISSPNTPGLRDLQTGSALDELLDALCTAREKLPKRVPLWLKLAPDLTDEQCSATAETLKTYPVDALIISNTTVSRDFPLKSKDKDQHGGLSGKVLMELSTRKLALFYRLTEGKIPLVGVGGIASAEDAYAKIRAGASLVQLYTALIFQGFGLVTSIQTGLADLLKRDGFSHLSEAIGIESKLPR